MLNVDALLLSTRAHMGTAPDERRRVFEGDVFHPAATILDKIYEKMGVCVSDTVDSLYRYQIAYDRGCFLPKNIISPVCPQTDIL